MGDFFFAAANPNPKIVAELNIAVWIIIDSIIFSLLLYFCVT
jgi:hypothetical protein